MKKLTQLFISILFIAGMSACNQQELENLQSQIDELKSTQIASISSQISSIQASISSLEKMDTELKSRIEELSKKEEELEATDEAQAKEMASLRETLSQLETSLSKRIDDLKTYVDEELKEQKDWVSATFSTLEQYQSTCSEIASIKETLTNQETALKKLVSDTESSIKGWVNEQLTGYYTIAEMDAKISALEKTISDGDEAQAKEFEKLRADLETAKADIKAAYEKAISDAITEFEGKHKEFGEDYDGHFRIANSFDDRGNLTTSDFMGWEWSATTNYKYDPQDVYTEIEELTGDYEENTKETAKVKIIETDAHGNWTKAYLFCKKTLETDSSEEDKMVTSKGEDTYYILTRNITYWE